MVWPFGSNKKEDEAFDALVDALKQDMIRLRKENPQAALEIEKKFKGDTQTYRGIRERLNSRPGRNEVGGHTDNFRVI